VTLRSLRACLAALALGVAGCSGSSPGTTPRTLDGCVREGPGVAITSFSVGGGQEEPAAVLGGGTTGVVLSNESDRQLCSWVPFARILAGHGLRVLLYDYATGDPAGEVTAAAGALRRAGVTRIILGGASEGAKASILAAAATPGVAGVAALSPERFLSGQDVFPAARQLSVPALFAVAQQDPYSHAATAALARLAPQPKRLVIVPGSAHGVALLRGAPGATVAASVLGFMDRFAPPPAPPGLAQECGGSAGTGPASAIAFSAGDGVRLHGDVLGSGDTAVVLAHESSSNVCGWFPYARELAHEGLRVVLFDARTSGSRLDLDVAAAVDEARTLGARRVVAMGASLGGAATLVAAARDCLRLSGVVSLSGEPDLRRFGGGLPPLDVWPDARRIAAPLLVLGSRQDVYVSPAQTARLLRTVRSRRAHAVLVAGGAHGWNLVQGPAASGRIKGAALAFLRTAEPPVATGC
jgi:dienelactone hydrolase